MTTVTQITTRWTTIATVGFRHSVSRNENRAAHGGVCHLQARQAKGGIVGRKVNSNGRHQEIGTAFAVTADELAHWQTIGSGK
jgi:hypothetical protein